VVEKFHENTEAKRTISLADDETRRVEQQLEVYEWYGGAVLQCEHHKH
jgi:hypothetical protein